MWVKYKAICAFNTRFCMILVLTISEQGFCAVVVQIFVCFTQGFVCFQYNKIDKRILLVGIYLVQGLLCF